MTPLKILVMSGSARTGSVNTKLAGAAARELALANADVTLISLDDYQLPVFNADDEQASGVPDNAVKLKKLIRSHDGVFISTPEYNHLPPPLLTNMIAWVSRLKDEEPLPPAGYMPVVAIASASPGPYGGARAIIALRVTLCTAWNALVLPRMISLSNAGTAFDETGALKIEAVATNLKVVIQQLLDVAARMK